jgi:hypothetical protein
MGRLVQTSIVNGVGFCLATAVWVGLFHTSFLQSIDVFFYRGVILLLITSFLLAIGLSWYKHHHVFGNIGMKDIVLCVTIFFSFQLLFFTHIPVTAERSLSVFLLSYLGMNRERSVSKDEIRRQYIDIYLDENQAINKRMTEQIRSGTVISTDSGVRITQRGMLLMQWYSIVARLFALKRTVLFSH